MEPESSDQKIVPADLGMKVEIDLVMIDGSERLEVEIVPDNFADFSLGYLGISTPLAQSILGKRAGATIPYLVEGGIEVRILRVTPSQKSPPKDIAERRQATIRKALDQSDRTNAVLFASSFSGKWGDYDPDAVSDEPDDEEK